MLLLRSLPILFVVLLSACGKPPKGPIGLVGDAGCIMYDESRSSNQSYTLTFKECAEGHIATTPDYDRILRQAYVDCSRPPIGPMCVMGDAAVFCADSRPMDRSNVCFGKQVIDGVCDLSFTDALNFVVTTADYFRVLRDYYRRRCE